jgi:RNA polymerase sigma factor (sigma-70 family)
MPDEPAVIALVGRASAGDQGAWNKIVERYAPLVWSICLRYRLDRQDIDDVGQSVWLLLVENLGNLRQPAALPGWLATTTQRECLRVLRVARQRGTAELPPEYQLAEGSAARMIEEEVLAAERDAALRTAFADLPGGCRELLSMLICDPPCAYADISATLGVAVGSIGPMRARCLERLRRSPQVSALTNTGPADIAVAPAHRNRADKR